MQPRAWHGTIHIRVRICTAVVLSNVKVNDNTVVSVHDVLTYL